MKVEHLADHLPSERPATDTHGTGYGCACVSRDARMCSVLRYGEDADERCECLCHQWDDDEDCET